MAPRTPSKLGSDGAEVTARLALDVGAKRPSSARRAPLSADSGTENKISGNGIEGFMERIGELATRLDQIQASAQLSCPDFLIWLSNQRNLTLLS